MNERLDFESGCSNRWLFFPRPAPNFVSNYFIEDYTIQPKSSSKKLEVWNHPIVCLYEDLENDGVCSDAKLKFMKSIFSTICEIPKSELDDESLIHLFSFSANLSDWDRFKDIYMKVPKDDSDSLIFAVVVGCRKFQHANEKFEELVKLVTDLLSKLVFPGISLFFYQLSLHAEQTIKIAKKFLVDDKLFLNEFKSCRSRRELSILVSNWKIAMDRFSRIGSNNNINYNNNNNNNIDNEQKKETQISNILEPLFDSKELDVISKRKLQVELLELSVNSKYETWELFEHFYLLIVTECVEKFEKSNNQPELEKRLKDTFVPICNIALKSLFENLIQKPEKATKGHEQNFFKLPKLPENAEQIFKSIAKVFSNSCFSHSIFQSFEIGLNHDDFFDVLCGIFANPKMLESMWFLENDDEKYDRKILKLLIEKCIPNVSIFSTTKVEQRFQKWFESDLDSVDRYYFPKLPFSQFRYFEWNEESREYVKKYFPYLELKKKIENQEKELEKEKEMSENNIDSNKKQKRNENDDIEVESTERETKKQKIRE